MENNDKQNVFKNYDYHLQGMLILATFFVLYTHSKLQSQWKAKNNMCELYEVHAIFPFMR